MIIKKTLLPFLLAILPLAAVFLDEKSATWIMVFLVAVFLLEKDKRINYHHFRKYLKPYLISVLVFILFTLLSPDFLLSLKVLERQTPLLIIPIILFSSNLDSQRTRIFLLTFLGGMFLISIFSFLYLLWFYETNLDWIKIMNDSQNSNTYLQYKFPHLIGTHPTYWSYLLIVANIILLNNRIFKVFNKIGIVIIGLIAFNVTIFYLSSRTPLLVNFAIHFMAIWIYVRRRNILIKARISILAFSVLAIFLTFNSPLLKAKIINITSDERIYLWPVAFNKIRNNNFVLGEGLGQGTLILKRHIIENGDNRVNYKSFDLHNQYLRHYLDMGILGILVLVYLVIFPLLQIKNLSLQKDHILISFTLLYILCLMTEASLYRFKGVIIFAIFSSIFMHINLQSTIGTDKE